MYCWYSNQMGEFKDPDVLLVQYLLKYHNGAYKYYKYCTVELRRSWQSLEFDEYVNAQFLFPRYRDENSKFCFLQKFKNWQNFCNKYLHANSTCSGPLSDYLSALCEKAAPGSLKNQVFQEKLTGQNVP